MGFRSFWAGIFFLVGVLACGTSGNEKQNSLTHISDTKTMKYAIEGKILYEQYCANCHQKDGEGLGKLIPPLAQADYMLEDVGRTVRIIKYGMKGEIKVNGTMYNQAMPPNPQLTNLEIAEITTYLYNIWGEKRGLVSTEEVANYLNEN
ncbi:c-type cytochrome [Pararhodonellum marinum]|uniref:c-type cytochrome n=1 Tax=Pararhodonellum marinum TaxID=2755358 RepID=UPI00188FF5C4|nr:cytochrome c [Pararhodonellum marinum]